MMRQYELVERVLKYDPTANEALINRAYVYAMRQHGTQKRASGELYFSHPLEVVNPRAAPPLLTLPDEKREILKRSPVDQVDRKSVV